MMSGQYSLFSAEATTRRFPHFLHLVPIPLRPESPASRATQEHVTLLSLCISAATVSFLNAYNCSTWSLALASNLSSCPHKEASTPYYQSDGKISHGLIRFPISLHSLSWLRWPPFWHAERVLTCSSPSLHPAICECY